MKDEGRFILVPSYFILSAARVWREAVWSSCWSLSRLPVAMTRHFSLKLRSPEVGRLVRSKVVSALAESGERCG